MNAQLGSQPQPADPRIQSPRVPVALPASSGSLPSVREIRDGDGDVWDAFVEAQPAASAYHRFAWRSFFHDVFGLETRYLGAFVDGELAGVLPLVRQKSPFFGDFLVSLPFFNYGGLLSASAAATDALLTTARELCLRLGSRHVELRHDSALPIDLPARTDKVTMILELPGSGEALMASLKAKVRSQIKRPEREGIRSFDGGIELVPQFYRVFARNMRDLGTPVYPPRFFREVMARCAANGRIFLAEMGGKIVAAALVLGDGDRLEIPWASSLREANRFGVNMYLYWKVLEWAIARGYRSFDFGRCTKDSGTFRFKRQWNAEPVQLYWHYVLNGADELPMINHSNPRYRTLIDLWTRQPVWLANVVGPWLSKHLP